MESICCDLGLHNQGHNVGKDLVVQSIVAVHQLRPSQWVGSGWKVLRTSHTMAVN